MLALQILAAPSMVHGTAAPAASGSLLKVQNLRPPPRPLLSQSLHFNRSPGGSSAR